MLCVDLMCTRDPVSSPFWKLYSGPSLIWCWSIDSNTRERDWKRDHVRPLATIESQEIILATDRFLLWKLFLPAEAILG